MTKKEEIIKWVGENYYTEGPLSDLWQVDKELSSKLDELIAERDREWRKNIDIMKLAIDKTKIDGKIGADYEIPLKILLDKILDSMK